MIKIVQLFDNDQLNRKLKKACSKIDQKIDVNQILANLYFSGGNTIRKDIVYLIDSSLVDQYFDELHQLAVCNFMVFVYADENEIFDNQVIERLADHYLSSDFNNIQIYTLLSLSRKALLGHSTTIFPRKLVASSVSEIEQFFDGVEQRVFWKNVKGRYIGCNKCFASDFQLDNVDVLLGKTDFELLDERSALEFSAYDSQIMKSGKAVLDFEKEIEFKSGEKKWLKISKYPHIKEGLVIGIIGKYEFLTSNSIDTSSVYSEDKLLNVLMNYSPNIISFKDKDSRFIKMNRAKVDFIGAKYQEEAIGKTEFEFSDDLYSKEAFAIEQQILFGGEAQNHIEYLSDSEGKSYWMKHLIAPIEDDKGNITGTLAIKTDVTELTLAKQLIDTERNLFQILIDNIPYPIYIKTEYSTFARANKALLELMRVDAVEELIDKTDFDFYPQDDAVRFFKEEQKIVKSGVPLVNKVENYKWGNNEEKWFSITKIPMCDSDGNCIGIIGMSHDITEQMSIKEH